MDYVNTEINFPESNIFKNNDPFTKNIFEVDFNEFSPKSELPEELSSQMQKLYDNLALDSADYIIEGSDGNTSYVFKKEIYLNREATLTKTVNDFGIFFEFKIINLTTGAMAYMANFTKDNEKNVWSIISQNYQTTIGNWDKRKEQDNDVYIQSLPLDQLDPLKEYLKVLTQ